MQAILGSACYHDRSAVLTSIFTSGRNVCSSVPLGPCTYQVRPVQLDLLQPFGSGIGLFPIRDITFSCHSYVVRNTSFAS